MSKSAPSSRLSTRRQLRTNSAVTPPRVVVGGDQPVGALDQVGAEQEPVAGLERCRRGRRGRRAAPRRRGCRWCRRGTRPAAGRRAAGAPRCSVKSPTSASTLQRRVALGERSPPRRAASARRRRPARSARAGPRAVNASSRVRVLSLVPLPSSTRVVASQSATISSACAAQDRPLAPRSGSTPGSRVISSNSSRARVVVEPLRRQRARLRRRGRGGRRRRSAADGPVRVEQHRDDRLAGGHRARRPVGEADPGQRPPRPGREEVAVGRAGVARRGERAAAAQHHLVGHELAVVLADGAGGRVEAGVGVVGRGRPLPAVAVDLAQVAGRAARRRAGGTSSVSARLPARRARRWPSATTACSHSASVGSRLPAQVA